MRPVLERPEGGRQEVLVRIARGQDQPTQSTQPATAFSDAKRQAIEAFERGYFTELSRRAKGNVSEMARQSGMERHHVRAYLRKYGVDKPGV